MKNDLKKSSGYYVDKYNVSPSFKAGLHQGQVTTGEIGALKKEIIFTGDVLNVTARIQGLCKKYHTDLLVSEELLNELDLGDDLKIQSLGKTNLKGRSEPMTLFSVQKL